MIGILLGPAQQQTQSASPLVTLMPFLLLGLVLYFIMIRPQRRRMQQQQSLVHSLEVGDEVLTIGGIFGTVRFVDEESDELTLEVAPGTTLRIIRSAVARKVTEDEPLDEDPEEEEGQAGGDGDAADEKGPWSDEGGTGEEK